MRRPIRIQVKPRWEDDEPVASPVRVGRPGPASKVAAALGMMLFWLYFFGWLGNGGADGLEMGFILFAVLQLPLLWTWLRQHVAGR
jgi:hypothetical protein